MKARVPKTNNQALIEQTKLHIITAKEKKLTNEVYLDVYNEIFDRVRNDIIEQLMATSLYELNKEFGFGKKRLLQYYNGISAMLLFMKNGVMGKSFTTDDCIKYCKEEFDIDVKVKE